MEKNCQFYAPESGLSGGLAYMHFLPIFLLTALNLAHGPVLDAYLSWKQLGCQWLPQFLVLT